HPRQVDLRNGVRRPAEVFARTSVGGSRKAGCSARKPRRDALVRGGPGRKGSLERDDPPLVQLLPSRLLRLKPRAALSRRGPPPALRAPRRQPERLSKAE